jgi:abequosyltransferase
MANVSSQYSVSMPQQMKLSICIATYRRAEFIAQTLQCILDQMDSRVELIVVDGASPDATSSVVVPLLAGVESSRYVREPVNSGVDGDYDRAVGYARGEYCWLMTDDDLLAPDAVARVLDALGHGPEAVIVNAQVRSADLSTLLSARLLNVESDREYVGGCESLFSDTANYLTFIGALIVRREIWMSRNRSNYMGTLFVHVGVLFQAPLNGHVVVMARPLITIRYGNAMWSARGFEIWMFKWPRLIWDFDCYSCEAKAAVVSREPWKRLRQLTLYRAIGSYSIEEYVRFLRDRPRDIFRLKAWVVARTPGAIANFIVSVYCVFLGSRASITAYDLERSPHATKWSKWLLNRVRG